VIVSPLLPNVPSFAQIYLEVMPNSQAQYARELSQANFDDLIEQARSEIRRINDKAG